MDFIRLHIILFKYLGRSSSILEMGIMPRINPDKGACKFFCIFSRPYTSAQFVKPPWRISPPGYHICAFQKKRNQQKHQFETPGGALKESEPLYLNLYRSIGIEFKVLLVDGYFFLCVWAPSLLNNETKVSITDFKVLLLCWILCEYVISPLSPVLVASPGGKWRGGMSHFNAIFPLHGEKINPTWIFWQRRNCGTETNRYGCNCYKKKFGLFSCHFWSISTAVWPFFRTKGPCPFWPWFRRLSLHLQKLWYTRLTAIWNTV